MYDGSIKAEEWGPTDRQIASGYSSNGGEAWLMVIIVFA